MVLNCSVDIKQLDAWQLAQVFPPTNTTLPPSSRRIAEISHLVDVYAIFFILFMLLLAIMIFCVASLPCMWGRKARQEKSRENLKDLFITSSSMDESFYGQLPLMRPSYIRNKSFGPVQLA